MRHVLQQISGGGFGGKVVKGRIVIKLGGGLITDKEKLCTPRLEVIDQMAKVIADISAEGYSVIVIHGAGSFGHLRAKRWQLHRGRINGYIASDIESISSQDDAVIAVRNDMLSLNDFVVEALREYGLEVEVFPPHFWASGTGLNFEGDLSIFSRTNSKAVKVCFGDVTSCPGEAEFGILSGDDLAYRLATEIEGVERLVFALGGVDGLLRNPPKEGVTQEIITEWRRSDGFTGEHHSAIDVTGGIFLKAERGAQAANMGIEVLMVRGDGDEGQDRVLAALRGEECLGTRILAD